MAGSARDRQRKERTAARIAAAEEARRKAAIRRRNISILVAGGAVLVVFFGVIIWRTRDNGKTSTTTGSDGSTTLPTTSSTPAESAAGKPCVAVADPLPTGAPAVPVQEGPPPTQLVMQDLVEGTGATVGANDTVTANYIGVSCSTGKIFDSSYKSGTPSPVPFPLSGVIPGWTQGLPGMKVGGQRLLGIPPDLAYGSTGSPPDILPDETLWFVVEVTDTKPAA